MSNTQGVEKDDLISDFVALGPILTKVHYTNASHDQLSQGDEKKSKSMWESHLESLQVKLQPLLLLYSNSDSEGARTEQCSGVWNIIEEQAVRANPDAFRELASLARENSVVWKTQMVLCHDPLLHHSRLSHPTTTQGDGSAIGVWVKNEHVEAWRLQTNRQHRAKLLLHQMEN